MHRLYTFTAHHRLKWLVAGIWVFLLVVVFATQLPKKFSDAERNEQSSFLPGEADSTRALEAVKKMKDGEEVPIVVVFRRSEKLSAADKQKISAAREKLNTLNLKQTGPFGQPVFSQDQTTAIFQAPLKTKDGSDKDSKAILDAVDKTRETLQTKKTVDGLAVKVTGGAGFSADAIKIFESINGTLLLAAVALVFILLILIYRSPIFLWIPLFSVIFAEIATRGVGYALTKAGLTVNGQSSSILSVLVLGAGTDYALLLVSRYKEELRKTEDKHVALDKALRSAGPAIIASGATVIAALLCLTFAKLNGTAGLGPIGAVGVAVAVITMLTLLPALLVITGRWAFWPFVPHVGDHNVDETHGSWRKIGDWVAKRPRPVWIGTLAILGIFCLGLLNYNTNLTSEDSYSKNVESVQGQKLIAKAFPAGQSIPTDIVVRDGARAQNVQEAVSQIQSVAAVKPVLTGKNGEVLLDATLKENPYSKKAYGTISEIRDVAKRAGGQDTFVGGATAIEKDVRDATQRDTKLIVPMALIVVFLILMVLLRALTAPIMLIGTVIVSFAAALGVGTIVFDKVFGFAGNDPGLLLFSFIFLVALGIDYNIFLMARVREETIKYGHAQGVLRGVAVTGGVITSAGLVLAGTFAVLGVLPLVVLTQIGFTVAFGVLLDTFLVRSVLVPALALDIGKKTWWPSKLAQAKESQDNGLAPTE